MDRIIVSWFHCFMILKQRKPNRLKNFDYSSSGYYFITICTKDRQKYFGNIIDNKMILNEYGEIVKKCWTEILNHFDNVEFDEFIVMPNHVHGIVVIVGAGSSRPSGLSRPMDLSRPILGQIIGYFKYQSTKYINDFVMKGSDNPINKGSDDPINKGSDDPTPTGKQNEIKQIFQRSFYDHIIRNEYSLFKIRQYIKDNPENWDEDRNNLINKSSPNSL